MRLEAQGDVVWFIASVCNFSIIYAIRDNRIINWFSLNNIAPRTNCYNLSET